MFAAGMTLCAWQRRVVVSDRLAAVALAVVALAGFLPQYEMIAALPLAYIILWLAVRLPFKRFGTRTDLSYGLYLYAWPVMQALTMTKVLALGYVPFTGVCIAISLGLAALSWTYVERPVMAWARKCDRAPGPAVVVQKSREPWASYPEASVAP
jgi:peptidoglycan/LPS O-acetylase OafA/YrhL